MHEDVVKEILRVEAEKIVYVSCNPATQARDVKLLAEKYSARRSRAFDMFPHTHHIENILLLEKNA
jgi:23S rRNA (uracil1939-C5)-methyltransferase